MKKFILKAISFSLIFSLLSPVYFYVKWYEKDIKKLPGSEIYHAINKSKKDSKKVEKLLIGDSIAMQAYNSYHFNERLYSLACNAAISIVGHYILLKNFLENHENPEDLEVLIIYRPSSFKNNLDEKFTFNYFLKPFYFEDNYPYFSDYVFSQIKKIPFYYSINIPLVRKSRWSPEYKNIPSDPGEAYLSKISISYLKQIQDLCKKHKVKDLQLICPFISDEFSLENFNDFNQQVEENGLSELFEGYYDQIVFIDKNEFRDRIHLKNIYKTLDNNYLNL